MKVLIETTCTCILVLHSNIIIILFFILLGVMLYHSRYPKVYVPDIDPTTIETSEAFPTIMGAIVK